ncbi:hypothetical protein HOD83_01825 [Candidatus Woesearchaeota archaeon]|jgi:hypothetical protein|nr:hypothetical protein [Candidatus Woesearchaeota archaeon]MBT4114112.1 hypothetical protein [Candidatus Woesearchaeota archaeon]MBT4248305.1 hypothetical protein [Candidatus Woesearchaeota archaeon]
MTFNQPSISQQDTLFDRIVNLGFMPKGREIMSSPLLLSETIRGYFGEHSKHVEGVVVFRENNIRKLAVLVKSDTLPMMTDTSVAKPVYFVPINRMLDDLESNAYGNWDWNGLINYPFYQKILQGDVMYDEGSVKQLKTIANLTEDLFLNAPIYSPSLRQFGLNADPEEDPTMRYLFGFLPEEVQEAYAFWEKEIPKFSSMINALRKKDFAE